MESDHLRDALQNNSKIRKVVYVLNQAPRHEDVWRSVVTAVRVLNLSTRWK